MHVVTKVLTAGAFAVAAAGFAAGALAQQKPEDTLKMRQGLMLAVKANFAPFGAFAAGKAPLPAEPEAKAENLAALARISPIAWAKGTENVPNSETKPAAFTSADFAKGWGALGEAAGALAVAARSGDAEAIKVATGGVGKTCKGCHDDFKAD